MNNKEKHLYDAVIRRMAARMIEINFAGSARKSKKS